jgi:hypothetical protein
MLCLPGRPGEARGDSAAPAYAAGGTSRTLAEVRSLFPRIELKADVSRAG